MSINCPHFSKCNSCHYNGDYQYGLDDKIDNLKQHFGAMLDDIEFSIFKSKPKHFRDRMEFRIFHNKDDIFYIMYGNAKKIFFVDECLVVNSVIYLLMPKLLKYIKANNTLKTKLYSIEFLSSKSKDMLVTLIYHKRLDDSWEQEAKKLQEIFDIKIVGRSKKQKIILSDDFVTEKLLIKNRDYIYKNLENSFTQPNSYVNEKMVGWCIDKLCDTKSDILELYCGSGNFTIAFSDYCNKILATEVSKNAIKSAKQNMVINNKTNIEFIRMSSKELVEAINKTREFKRLKNINLSNYNFQTVFVDPPRAGLDNDTLKLLAGFQNIIYISCNYISLYENLKFLLKSHKLISFAIFDQFAYSKHLECGALLKK